jgi:lysophospholipase L1-like esterase
LSADLVESQLSRHAERGLKKKNIARRARFACVVLGWLSVAGVTATPASAQTTDFESQVATFERKDVKFPPPTGAIVVTGSSTIRLWKQIRNDLAPLETIPRGFGSSTADDLDYYLDRLVLPYAPRAVIIYEGDHDLQVGMTPEFILERMTSVVQRIGAAYPAARIYLVSVKPSLKYSSLWPQAQVVNQMLAELCLYVPNCSYVDTASYLLLPNGKPNTAYFRSDRVHLNDAGYAVWNAVLKPVLLAGEDEHIVLPELRDQDVGIVSGAGFSSTGSGTVTVYGSGAGVGGNADGFHFAWRQLTGNGQITARIAAQPDASGNPVAGVMLRESLNPNARSAFTYLSPASGAGSAFRATIGGATIAGNNPLPSATTPHWLKLVRKAATVYCWRATDGVTWKDCGKAKLTGLKQTVYVGLAVSSAGDGAVAAAQFDNVYIHGTTSLPALP